MENSLVKFKCLISLKDLKKEFVLMTCELCSIRKNYDGQNIEIYPYSNNFPSFYLDLVIKKYKHHLGKESVFVNKETIKTKKERLKLIKNLMYADIQYTQQKKANNLTNYNINEALINLSTLIGKRLFFRFISQPDEVIINTWADSYKFKVYYISQALRSYLLQSKLYTDWKINDFYNFLVEIEKETNRKDSLEIDDYVDKWVDEIKYNEYKFKKTRHDFKR